MENNTYQTEHTLIISPLTFYRVKDKGVYVKPREVATLLKIKQPFQFTADIKKLYGESCYLKGEETQSFRIAEQDDNRTIFIKVEVLLDYLEKNCHKGSHKLDYIAREWVYSTLKKYSEENK